MPRPTLPPDAQAAVEELESRIESLEQLGLTAETREAQDAALDEAIALAREVLAIRIEHQGNSAEVVRWSTAAGAPSEWYELADTRRRVEDMQRFRRFDADARSALASLVATETEVTPLYSEGRYAEALSVTEHQLAVLRRVLGAEHPDALIWTNAKGAILLSLGRLVEAEPYLREALEFGRRVLGDDHPNTLISVGNMGTLHESQGRLDEAEPYHRDALEGCRRVLGDDHPNTLTSFNNVGNLLVSQGRLDEAEPYARAALEGRRRVLGDDDPSTLTSVNNMGLLLQDQGRFDEAEPHYREALEGSRRLLGDDHPLTLTSVNNMGNLLESQGRLVEAEPYYREALGGRRRVLGDDHPDTLISVGNMGTLLGCGGRLVEAEPYYREALKGIRRVLGDDHPNALTSVNNMGFLLWSQGRFNEAEPYYHEALEDCSRVLGDDHPNTLTSVSNMGLLLWSQGRFNEAEPYDRKALDGRRRVLGVEHPDTLTSVGNIGVLLQSQGRLAEAEPYFHEALETAERLRIGVIGDASTRAQFAGVLRLSDIAAGYARTLVGLGRGSEALGVIERGGSRAALDLLAGDNVAAVASLRGLGDPERLARYEAAAAKEQAALVDLRDAEARPPALQKQREVYASIESLSQIERDQRVAQVESDIAAARERVLDARRTLSERTAAVFAELRGLIPATNPLTTVQVLAGLAPGQALLMFSFTDDGAIALVARDGQVHGFTLGDSRDATTALTQRLGDLRSQIELRPGVGTSDLPVVLQAARDPILPADLLAILTGSTAITVVPDGPLIGIPMELFIADTPIAYAPSATIAMDRVRVAGEIAAQRALAAAGANAAGNSAPVTAVVLGDPIFDRRAPSESDPALPNSGVLLAMVVEDGPAAAAGLSRGDVILSYDGIELAAPDSLGPARAEVDAAIADGSRPADQRVTISYWRDGQTLSTELPPGRLGVQLSQAPAAEGLRSMRTLDQLSTERGMSEFAANASALDQLRLYGGTLDQLPGTRSEAEAIAGLLPGATLLLGEDATAPNLTRAVETVHPRYVHLATHGLMGSADRPQDASLALTQPETPTPDDTGFLTLQDLLAQWGGDLKGTDLVVLSACDTGRGIQSGDTQMSLPLGFFQAGAPTVIASLWKVDDSATALLMARLYANLLGRTESARQIDGESYGPGEPLPKLTALREAQAWLRGLTDDQLAGVMVDGVFIGSTERGPGPSRADPNARPGRPFEHPWFWAGFILIGSPE